MSFNKTINVYSAQNICVQTIQKFIKSRVMSQLRLKRSNRSRRHGLQTLGANSLMIRTYLRNYNFKSIDQYFYLIHTTRNIADSFYENILYYVVKINIRFFQNTVDEKRNIFFAKYLVTQNLHA
ncbi:hypothetical protein Bhyg_08042 [Pseudolycoriella hygida]|uniref:Uncharacterized protein n=1 Tax=Pseudolycoriella hygida TaxID=35572 RepID=A0A9Q0N548_9DIPT|nr:hypothetical protein Bhyg_08042 [Pseudolycoriella hygida]